MNQRTQKLIVLDMSLFELQREYMDIASRRRNGDFSDKRESLSFRHSGIMEGLSGFIKNKHWLKLSEFMDSVHKLTFQVNEGDRSRVLKGNPPVVFTEALFCLNPNIGQITNKSRDHLSLMYVKYIDCKSKGELEHMIWASKNPSVVRQLIPSKNEILKDLGLDIVA